MISDPISFEALFRTKGISLFLAYRNFALYQFCGYGMIFFGSGSDFEGIFGSGSCMIFFIISESLSASRELHGKLALYS
jgi:hypothetical protein